ncbi:hypothetical protein [Nostoc sp.]|uniref:hypothetical protein n=1 Tax=Nostoc sp. TaxID=1180 RepID=UPI002FF4D707
MTTTLAQLATAFLSRDGLAPSTLKSYEQTLLSLLKEHGRTTYRVSRPSTAERLSPKFR